MTTNDESAMPEPQTPSPDPALQQITFVPYLLPALHSGDFRVTVNQQVLVDGQVRDSFASSQAFSVTGERYRLDPAHISSVYPPAGLQGDFDHQLAHVVLSAATLPWQRSPFIHGKPPQGDEPMASWLAVLLFDQDDPPPSPRNITLSELRRSAEVFFPDPHGEIGEQPDDSLTVIDVPVELFNAIAPSVADLNWNAHVRSVDSQAKASDQGALPALDYAVVVGNRLAVKGHVSVAHLVSLEHYADYLPRADGSASPLLPPGTRAVRLVTLNNWAFSSLDRQQSFRQLLSAIDHAPATLQLPWQAPPGTPDTAQADADSTLETAFGLGYTAMNHDLRDGSRSVSWYRGPLLPVANPLALSPPWGNPDALLRYDPANGLLDVSYSAAWQVGRLLALHDSSFATALYRWKLGHTRQQVQALEEEVLDEELQALVSVPVANYAEQSPQARAALRSDRMQNVLSGIVSLAVSGLSAHLERDED